MIQSIYINAYIIYIMRLPLSKICSFINHMCSTYRIDESHGLKHALDVYKYCRILVDHQIISHPQLLEQQNIIYTAALLHDTCDKKYMHEDLGITYIKCFLEDTKCYQTHENDIILQIIQTMSYSKVQAQGYPELGNYQQAYHIVREADLLAAYDFDRCLVFTMHHYKVDYKTAFAIAKELYDKRMAKHVDHGLITSEKGLSLASSLLDENIKQIAYIEALLKHDDS